MCCTSSPPTVPSPTSTSREASPRGAEYDLGDIAWTPTQRSTFLWQIGRADRTGGEYALATRSPARPRPRGYGKPARVPDDLTFTIGTDWEPEDWYYAQTESVPGSGGRLDPPGRIRDGHRAGRRQPNRPRGVRSRRDRLPGQRRPRTRDSDGPPGMTSGGSGHVSVVTAARRARTTFRCYSTRVR
ncbi:polysaccharide lyase family protein [Streptomyces sp. NPDC050315]|uniref:polysaccharide lyase family protein n=1 Tax=Streptomyces sp. NPDC050315 TaxID=3155039 RepID=UPI003442D49D